MELKDKQSANFIEADKAYELSALIHADSFFYALFDYGHKLAKSGKIAVDSLSDEYILGASKGSIRKSKLGILNNFFTLIPKDEFHHGDITKYVTSACDITDQDEYIFRSDYIPNHNLRVCYAISKKEISLINKFYESSSLIHYISAALGSIDNEKDGVYAHFMGDALIVVTMCNGRLQNANCYPNETSETGVYYLALNYQQGNLSDKKIPIYVSGDICQNDETATLIDKYFAKASLTTPPITLDGVQLKSAHHHYPLYAISKCG